MKFDMVKVFCDKTQKVEWANPRQGQKTKGMDPRCTRCGLIHKEISK